MWLNAWKIFLEFFNLIFDAKLRKYDFLDDKLL